MPSTSKKLFRWLIIAFAYLIMAKLGQSIAFEQTNTYPVWPPTGLAIAALFYFGLSTWPAVFMGAFIVNITAGIPLVAAITIGIGNTLEAIIACWLLTRYVGNSLFNSVVNVTKFSITIFFATMVSASIGASILFFSDSTYLAFYPLAWSSWWLSDLVSGLIITPFLLIWIKVNKDVLKTFFKIDGLLWLITAASILVVFSDLFVIGTEHYPFAFIYLPITLWAGYRFGHFGATLYLIIISVFAIHGTSNGFGPFIRVSEVETVLLLQSFIVVMMLATLIITASIEEKKLANKQLAKSQQTLKQLVAQQSGDLQTAADELKLAEIVFKESIVPIIIADTDALILRVNPAFTRVTGYTHEEVVGKNPRLLQSGKHDEVFYKSLWKSITDNGCWQGEVWDRRKNGEVYPSWLTMAAVRDEQFKIAQYICIFDDISAKKVDEDRIFKLAHFDLVSGLHNRASFHEQLELAINYAERQKHNLSLLYLDLDNFKLINDASGHLIGDLLLKHVAQRLKHIVRDEDSIARIGGDEFVVLVMGTNNSKNVAGIADKILKEIAKPILLGNTEVVVTSSIGISTYPADGTDADSLLRNADVAMYRAKDSGRNIYQFFTAEMNDQAEDRLLLENDMRKGIHANEFILHYQPQVDLASDKIVGCEALVRWDHPTRGRLPPNLFIPIAEECGLIKELGLWVMEEACSQQVKWSKQGLPKLKMAINISSRQFLSQDLTHQIEDVIKLTGIEPCYLELELTEGSIMENVEENIQVLQHLNSMGVLLSIDDFGTGYSSMAYLKRFPINKLKIDQSFVTDLATDTDDAAIVQAINVLGHSLHLTVIAEGVETKEQLDFLNLIGCDEIQGYYFSKPVSAEAFEKILSLQA